MSLEINRYPKSEAFEIVAITDSGGLAVFEINAIYENTNIRQLENVFIVGNENYNGTHLISSYSQTSPTSLLLTTSTAYTSNETSGLLLSQTFADISCNWSASRKTPIALELQRKDLNVVSTAVGAGSKLVIEFDIDVSGIFAVSDYFYLFSENIYDGYATVLDINYTGNNAKIRCSLDYISDTTSGFINSNVYRENYYIQLSVIIDSVTTVLELYPSSKGLIVYDLHPILLSYLKQDNEFDYNEVSIKDINLTKTFTFNTLEKWISSDESTTVYTEEFHYCFARRNIGDVNTMYEFVVRVAGNLPLAKWLNKGEVNAYYTTDSYPLYPFAVDIYSEVGIVEKKELALDINLQTVSTNTVNLNDAENALNRIRLEKNYNYSAKYLDISLFKSSVKVNHFWSLIGVDGILQDSFTTQTGKLVDANCLQLAIGANLTQLFFYDYIVYELDTLSYDGDGVLQLDTDYSFEAITAGKIWNLNFADILGNLYFFPLTDYFSDDRSFHIIHGIKYDLSLNETSIYGVVINGSNATQSDYFYDAVNGMDKITSGGDSIFTPRKPDKTRLYTLGIDDVNYYNVDLLPIE